MKHIDHMTQMKSFTFKDEILICKSHNEVVSFLCTCKEKLCTTCLKEGGHYQNHPDFRIIPSKEIKRVFINEVEELESLYSDLLDLEEGDLLAGVEQYGMNLLKINNDSDYEGQFTKNITHMSHFTQGFLILLTNSSVKFFSELFKKERKVFQEVKKCRENIRVLSESEKLLKYEHTIDLINAITKLKEKAYLAIIEKNGKINILQILFLQKNEELEGGCEKMIKEFFNLFDENENYPEESKKIPNYNNSVISIHNSLREAKFSSIPSQKMRKSRERYEINTSRIESELNLLLKSPEDEFKCESFKIKSSSMWKEEMIPKLSKSREGYSLSYEKNYRPNENFSYEKNINEFKNGIDEMNDSVLSYGDRKSVFTEFNAYHTGNNENRNRIDKIIRKYRGKTIFDGRFGNKKGSFKDIYGGAKLNSQNSLNSHNNQSSRYLQFPQYENYNNFYNTPTPIAKISKQAGTQTCMDCGGSFICTQLYKKKRCNSCQNVHYNKVAGAKPFYQYNSYKAGKMNQMCSSCKTMFIVPVALAKQRKTCYYCFKSGTGNKNPQINYNNFLNENS